MPSVEWQRLFLVGAIALAISLTGVPIVRRVALRFDITDHPANGKFHTVTTPYLGGVAVAIAVLGAAMVGGWQRQAWDLLAAAAIVACIGLIDDIRATKPLARISIEIIAASIAFAAGARVRIFGGLPDAILTIAWLVGITNSYNLLDNMDGCAPSVLAISASALLAAAVLEGQVLVATLAVAIVAAALGFLVYNWHPARIFLGDAGSLFLGFLVSATALKLHFPVGHVASVGAVALIATPALFDTTLV